MGPEDDKGPWGNKKRNLQETNIRKLQPQLQPLSKCNNFHMNIYRGYNYVNTGDDGFDSNGNINISGGNLEIWGAKSGSFGDFVDLEGTFTISGGKVFLVGKAGMMEPNNWKNY